MLSRLKPHAPVIITAVVVSALMAGGPALAKAGYDAVNANKVDGKHAVGSGASSKARAGKLVATNNKGKLPNNIIAKAPDSAKVGGKSLSSLGTTVITSHGSATATSSEQTFCHTQAFKAKQPSIAIVDVSVDVPGGAGGTTLVAQSAVSTDDWDTYEMSNTSWWIADTATANNYASVSNSGAVELRKGATYSFGAVAARAFGSDSGSGDCRVTVQISPKLPGSKAISTKVKHGGSQQRLAQR